MNYEGAGVIAMNRFFLIIAGIIRKFETSNIMYDGNTESPRNS
jgi:hypothetical protein